MPGQGVTVSLWARAHSHIYGPCALHGMASILISCPHFPLNCLLREEVYFAAGSGFSTA